ncbi:hypothetical protein TOC8172_28260 [Pseudomonas syringae]
MNERGATLASWRIATRTNGASVRGSGCVFFAAGGQGHRQNTGKNKQSKAVPEHGNLNVQ